MQTFLSTCAPMQTFLSSLLELISTHARARVHTRTLRFREGLRGVRRHSLVKGTPTVIGAGDVIDVLKSGGTSAEPSISFVLQAPSQHSCPSASAQPSGRASQPAAA